VPIDGILVRQWHFAMRARDLSGYVFLIHVAIQLGSTFVRSYTCSVGLGDANGAPQRSGCNIDIGKERRKDTT
jgi:hypothetical protein